MPAKGLEGVIATETSISFIDGKKGKLLYRGYNIKDIAKHCSFEEVCYLLLFKSLPSRKELDSFKRELSKRRNLPKQMVRIMRNFCTELLPIDALRTSVSLLKCYDPTKGKRSRKSEIIKGIDLIAKFPTLVAYYYRINHKKKIIPPNRRMGHAENFLYMLNGKKPDKLDSQVVDLDLRLHAEHGLNASTFSARVTISTLSDMYAAITSAVGTLEGPLHGGAASRVVKMLEEIGSIDKMEGFVKESIKKHRRIMGFGHRVYKVLDPRVLVLRGISAKLCKLKNDTVLFDMLIRLEKVMERQGLYKKGIYPNVDLYTGTNYRALGIPEVLYDPMFALGRIAGWVAHVIEQLDDNRLIRPRAKYIGKMDKRFIPLAKRR